MENVTLVAPDGREYVTASPREINDLLVSGYKTLKQVNDSEDKKKKSTPAKKEETPKKSEKVEDNSTETKDDQPIPATPDTGHTPATDAN